MEDEHFSVIEHMKLGLLPTIDWVGHEKVEDIKKLPRWLRRKKKKGISRPFGTMGLARRKK